MTSDEDGARRRRRAERSSTAALFLTVLLVGIAVALWTDLSFVARVAIAGGAGIIAAAVTYAIVKR